MSTEHENPARSSRLDPEGGGDPADGQLPALPAVPDGTFQRIEATLVGIVPTQALRDLLRAAASLCGMESTESLVLLTHELVKNAQALLEPEVRVAVMRTPPGGARVEVRDYGYGIPQLRLDGDALGLRIVEALSSRWGVDQFLPGKIVWFELDP